jgi:hypothetical protein
MRLRQVDREEATLWTFRGKVDPSIEADMRAVRQMLGLDPNAEELRVVYGSVAANDKEIAILSRSILEVMVDLSSFITVPEAHVTDRRVGPTAEPEAGPSGPMSGSQVPEAAGRRPRGVPCRDYWFSIDDRDIPSSACSPSCISSSLVETGSKGTPTVLTIPTG